MQAKYNYKEISLTDLEASTTLMWRVFSEFEAPEYSQEGIAEFKSFIEHETLKNKVEDKDIVLHGCYDNNKLVGVIGYNTTFHINLLFVDKDYHKQGIAKKLFHIMLSHCQSITNDYSITVNSSPYGHKIYKRLGFIDTGSKQTINGIIFYPMKYINR